jgi:toxin-antitoxin system PIN domain toxin
LALALSEHPGHQVAQDWYADLDPTPESLLFCRSTELSVLRLLSSKRILNSMNIAALTNNEAVSALKKMQQNPLVGSAVESSTTKALWFKMAARPSASPKLWMDAYLAAFAICGRHEMVSFDKGFRQYEADGLELKLLRAA